MLQRDVDDDEDDSLVTEVSLTELSLTELSLTELSVPELPSLGRFGRYELLGRMAVGGMAEIFLARERGACGGTRQVVVKVLRPQLEHDRELQSLFVVEGRVALRLNHPNLCHVYEVGIEHGRHFIAMEHVHGITLRDLVRRAARAGALVPTPILVRIAADVAAALHAAHCARDASGAPLGIVHRDVSPHNVMVGFDGVVKLLDFGVAHARTDAQPREAPGLIRGKLGYLAPEQCVGHPVDARTDVFALGVCAWEGLTGRRLFKRAESYDTLQAIVSEDPPHPRTWGAPVPEALAAIVRRALDRAPGLRFQSARELQEALEQYLVDRGELVGAPQIAAYLSALGARASRPELDRSPSVLGWLEGRGRAPRVLGPRRRRGRLVAAGAAGLVAVASLVGLALPAPAPPPSIARDTSQDWTVSPVESLPPASPESGHEPRLTVGPAAPEPRRDDSGESVVVAEGPTLECEPGGAPLPRPRRRRPPPGGFVNDPGF